MRKDISCVIPTPTVIMTRPPSYLFIKYQITLKFPTGLIIRPHVYWVISGGVTANTSPPLPQLDIFTNTSLPSLPPSPPFTSIWTLEHHYCFDLWWPSSAHLVPSDLPHTVCTDCHHHNVIRSRNSLSPSCQSNKIIILTVNI